MDESLARAFRYLPDGGFKVFPHGLHASEYTLHTIGILVKITQPLSEIRRPFLQLPNIRNRKTKEFRRYCCGKRLSEIRNHIHAAFGLNLVEQERHNVLDMPPQLFHAIGIENLCR